MSTDSHPLGDVDAAPEASPRGLRGHVVVVTGAAQGIGAAYADRLAAEGCRLIVADLRVEKLAEVAERNVERGADVLSMPTDVTDTSAVKELFSRAVERFGRLDGLVNNAAIYFGLRPVDSHLLDRERWERTMRVNVWGTFLCSSLAAEVMKPQGRGRIVNVSSSTAYFGPPKMADYVASKGAIISLSRALAREYGSFGITVNTIAPGGTWTEASQELFGEASRTTDPATLRAAQIAQQAVPRQQVPDDLAGTVCYLLSDDAAMVTGQALVVDGGHAFN